MIIYIVILNINYQTSLSSFSYKIIQNTLCVILFIFNIQVIINSNIQKR